MHSSLSQKGWEPGSQWSTSPSKGRRRWLSQLKQSDRERSNSPLLCPLAIWFLNQLDGAHPHWGAPCGPVELTHKIDHHGSLGLKTFAVSTFALLKCFLGPPCQEEGWKVTWGCPSWDPNPAEPTLMSRPRCVTSHQISQSAQRIRRNIKLLLF